MKKPVLLLLLVVWVMNVNARFVIDTTTATFSLNLTTETGTIMGTLLQPVNSAKMPVVLIIAGSGPTDRNGNNSMSKTESLRLLAQALAANGIASLRYDKRGVAASAAAGKPEIELRFEDYVQDAEAWINLLKKDQRFSTVIVAGHSEGSLIGMIAAQGKADGFISIAGPGRPAGIVFKEQLAKQLPVIKQASYTIIDSLMIGEKVKSVSPLLFSLFRPSVQPYLISWFKYNPATEIARLTIPVLIVQGTKDLQVATKDAELLVAANPRAKQVLIENMNHVLKTIEGDEVENNASYNKPSLPVNTVLVKEITEFVLHRKL